MEHRSLISSRFCRGQMTGEEVVELANGSSQVVRQRGLRDAFAPASLFNRHNMGEFTRLSAMAPIAPCDYAQF